MKRSLPLLLSLATLLVSGCDVLEPHALWEAVLPVLPGHWADTFPAAEARLVVGDADGVTSAEIVRLEALRYPVRICKRRNSVVLLYPRTGSGGEILRPFGAVFPASGEEKSRVLTLTAAGGFAAERLLRLAERGFPVESFNSERLLKLIKDKGGDPWDFDQERLETDLAAFDFSVYSLCKLPTRPVARRLPTGEWFQESPAAPVWQSDDEGLLTIPALSYGCHTLFRRTARERVYLSVSEREVVFFEQSDGRVFSPSRRY